MLADLRTSEQQTTKRLSYLPPSHQVGTHLKTPQYPIWVVCCESHYSCLFSRDTVVTADNPPITTFDVFYYDGLALQEDEIRLTIGMWPRYLFFIFLVIRSSAVNVGGIDNDKTV